jgi:hypothetical protein
MPNYKPVYQKMAGGKTVRIPGMVMGGATGGDEPTAQQQAKKAWKKKGRGRVKKWFKRTFGGSGDKELCTKGNCK